ncbi:MAG: thiopurine S-methyltransferase [Pseudomonadota bacterium]|nr:MAG: thiopurine S-methyltransferase [Pseudomonadota bacterium]
MDAGFWHQRWVSEQIGFHQEQINPYLQRFWPALGLRAGTTVFVPLCGKSRDMLWLAEQGFGVLGVEVSPLAVEAFFAENEMCAVREERGAFEVWCGGAISIWQGDYFDLAVDDLAGVGAVFDRAALVAMPGSLQGAYVEHLFAICPPGMRQLLVTLEYPQAEMDGPPFSVGEAVVRRLYEPHAAVQRLLTEDVWSANPRFAQRGLSALNENVYGIGEHAGGAG